MEQGLEKQDEAIKELTTAYNKIPTTEKLLLITKITQMNKTRVIPVILNQTTLRMILQKIRITIPARINQM